MIVLCPVIKTLLQRTSQASHKEKGVKSKKMENVLEDLATKWVSS